jgi:membrane protease subunit HflK
MPPTVPSPLSPVPSRKRELPLARGLKAAAASVRWIAVLLLVLFGASGITVVEPGEVALVLRFGRLHGATPADRIKQPGLLFALPYPLDEVIRIPVRREGELLIEDVWKPLASGDASGTINPIREGYVLTGDQNLIQAKLLVKYKITEPVEFVLRHRSDTRLLRDAVIASLSHTISGWNVDATLRQQAEIDGVNESLSSATLRRAQSRLDAVAYGLTLSALEFQELHPPRHVVAEFQQVQSAKIAIETSVREAEGFAAREIPKAESDRSRLVADATTFANALTANANAEVSVFSELLTQYQRQPELVRQRLYYETLEELLNQIGRVRYVAPNTRLMIPVENSPRKESETP